ncbi:mannose-1-phosphate guanylyltransferase [Brevundimonas sp. LM2]|uniref:AGE family epimerase/isomerase n=1 Tax=Brevundimonas sp. LM2 TaxID=1938605 RepID=UPI0009838ECC|nr:AGE family epimerase/isomerase [Brevundimonas sp. LM2]AQR62335.1 mannose-1-phosphate guanylyltransferase [Brevundimonas sp. LM2]
MALYPVIMCGGGGTRLWPASRPSRPKQFMPMLGNRSLFQDTISRVAPLAGDGGALIVVAGVAHRQWVLEQLDEVDVQAVVLLEPEARDSAAAMAAAAIWTQAADRHGVNVFVASDHSIPDAEAFREAAREAAASAASDGRIVTLGVRPTAPSAAYGYIKAAGHGLSDVEAFVEKPDAALAAHYIASGYLWNSGNFVVSARVLLDELKSHAPAVEDAARAAVTAGGLAGVHVLGAAFNRSPKVSIDYAVMEKTHAASVLAVDFAWSDLGAWDAIAESGEGNSGLQLFEDSEGCLTRAPDGVIIAAIGVRNLAIIAEQDAVLVCDLSRAQDVKKVVERLKLTSPRHLDFAAAEVEALAAGAARFADWLRTRALPTWSTLGQSEAGVFQESLSLDGRSAPSSRRARVQARQIYVFSEAGRLGWAGPWRRAVSTGLERLHVDYLRSDGLCRTLLSADGEPLDETAMVYDQAFVLFALAAARQAGVPGGAWGDLDQAAARLRDVLLAQALPNGALVESGTDPYQSNCHMHLLEASMAWEALTGDPEWAQMADRLVALAFSRFIDPAGGFLREFFDADWAPAEGEAGRLVEPGHQFEWAWLLARHGRARGSSAAVAAAKSLFAFGLGGLDERRGVALDALNDDGSIRSRRARLWPQTEWLKASLILAELSEDVERAQYLRQAAAAQRALWLYLTPAGLWHDKSLPDRSFMDEPAPATSFYHIMAAFGQLVSSWELAGGAGRLGLD